MLTHELAVGTRVRIKVGKYAQRRGPLIRCPADKDPKLRGYFVFLDGKEVGPYTASELDVQVIGT